MLKRDYFVAACQAELYRNKSWVIAAFAMIQEDPEAWRKDPYPYRLVATRAGYLFVDPTHPEQLQALDDATDMSVPAFNAAEFLVIQPLEIPNYRPSTFGNPNAGPLKTTYGNFLFNWIIFVYPFGAKIPYQNKRVSPSEVEALIAPRLEDDLPEGQNVRSIAEVAPIFTKEYLKCVDSAFYTTGFTQLWVPADTEKSLLPPPGLVEYRKQLYKEYEGRLHDPAAIAEIDAKLVAFDAEYLKGDEAEGFLISSKSRSIVRKKLFLQIGAEPGLDDNVQVDNVPTSLSEGWDVSKFPTMNNTQRAGSFNRGAQTALGGESVKWLLRASSNMLVAKDDCGTKLGYPTLFTDANIKRYIGFSIVTPQGSEVISKETAGAYLGKTLMVRSPMFCSLSKTDYCKICVGPRLALNPTALSSAVTDYGSTFMSIFMSSAHSTGLSLAHMDFKTELQ